MLDQEAALAVGHGADELELVGGEAEAVHVVLGARRG
jgi:hypothetical protein